MKIILALVMLLCLVLVSGAQQNLGCSGAPRPNEPQCLAGTHAEYECVCDGPMGPCHWVKHCVPN
jgi:hypothetical protein